MAESRTEEIDRISCEEEERVSKGFNIRTFFSVDDGHIDRVRKAIARTSESNLLNLRYIPAARLVHVNTQWRAQKQTEGFPIGLTSGDWRPSMPLPDETLREDFRLVKLWTSNLADALYIELPGAGELLRVESNGAFTPVDLAGATPSAMDLAPDDPDVWNALGVALEVGGKCLEATEAYEHALSLAPLHRKAANNLGFLLEKRMQAGEVELHGRATEAWKLRLLICRDEGQSIKMAAEHLAKLGVTDETIQRWLEQERSPSSIAE